jgi:hypothetical protein
MNELCKILCKYYSSSLSLMSMSTLYLALYFFAFNCSSMRLSFKYSCCRAAFSFSRLSRISLTDSLFGAFPIFFSAGVSLLLLLKYGIKSVYLIDYLINKKYYYFMFNIRILTYFLCRFPGILLYLQYHLLDEHLVVEMVEYLQ